MPPEERGVSGVNWVEVALILVAGAAGGVLSYIYAITVGTPPILKGALGVLASSALGTGAGFIGVYVIANSDTRSLLRCLGFALLCGFSWKPVYDGGEAIVKQGGLRQELKANKEAVRSLGAQTLERPEFQTR